MVWYIFFQKKAPNSDHFNEFYYRKLRVLQKIDGGESQTKLKKTREVAVKLPCNLAKQREKQIYTDKNSRQ